MTRRRQFLAARPFEMMTWDAFRREHDDAQIRSPPASADLTRPGDA